MKINPISAYNPNRNYSPPKKYQKSANNIIQFEYFKNGGYFPTVAFLGIDKTKYNRKNFIPYFSDKIQKKLKPYTKEDIENVIQNVQKRTNAPYETVMEVISRISQFATYKNFLDIEGLEKASFTSFLNYADQPLADVLTYIGFKKGFFPPLAFYKDYNFQSAPKQPLLLSGDDTKYIEAYKNTSDKNPKNKLFKVIQQTVSDDKTNAVHLEGVGIKKGNSYISYDILGHDMSLEDTAVYVIQQMKKRGVDLNQILNGDIIFDSGKLFKGFDTDKVKILTNSKRGQDPDSVAQMISPIVPDEAAIKSAMSKILDECEIKDRSLTFPILAKYLDTMLTCYSERTLQEALLKMHEKIVQKAAEYSKREKDILYVIPQYTKSFSLITLTYMKVNNIPKNKIVGDITCGKKIKNAKNKVFVILDDFIGSGNSFIYEGFNYAGFAKKYKNDNANLIFAPVVALKNGERKIKKMSQLLGRSDKDCVCANETIDFKEFENEVEDSANYTKQELIEAVLGDLGYKQNKSASMMPYTIHDNNSEAANEFLSIFYPKSVNLEDLRV